VLVSRDVLRSAERLKTEDLSVGVARSTCRPPISDHPTFRATQKPAGALTSAHAKPFGGSTRLAIWYSFFLFLFISNYFCVLLIAAGSGGVTHGGTRGRSPGLSEIALLPVGSGARRLNHARLNHALAPRSGSLAKLAASRRASSLVSILAALRRPGSCS